MMRRICPAIALITTAAMTSCGALPLSLSEGQGDNAIPAAPPVQRDARVAPNPERAKSWMLPEAKSEDLE